ncbi:DUF1538 domain-containing protein [Heliorestis convoluta]|uniref:DUF1538 domain-containing protein n=1 Tax=Heliorestis convoluta TaxID=356322 RepID=A0A5Q2N3Y6_9FIRM|nr:DUF1538 domain-containing protein [Heliorestis convoluta]QGG46980.1 hypothetical protein FTV88_0823 [Heliorestis convoluta]
MSDLVIFQGMGHVFLEVFQALAPLLLFFFFFQIFYLKQSKEFVIRVVKGVVLTFFGLTLFLHGVHIGFLPAGREMGEIMGAYEHRWILIPIGFVLGFVATMAEPAVRVLSSQVQEASTGYIQEKIMIYTLSFGVAVFVALGMAKIIYGIPLYYLVVPGYLLAMVLLKFSNATFTSIAFDAGGVATGPMTVTFIMAMAIGVATVMENRDPVIDGFGLIALVALAPILSVITLGVFLGHREKEEA